MKTKILSLVSVMVAVVILQAGIGLAQEPDYQDSPFGIHPAVPVSEAQNIGIKWTRGGTGPYVFWALVDPNMTGDPAQFQWQGVTKKGPFDYDKTISAPHNAGLEILWNIDIQPKNTQNTHQVPGTWLPVDKAAYRVFVKEAVKRYPYVQYWQIGNEPIYKGQAGYGQFILLTYEAIKEANPQAKVVIGGISGLGMVQTIEEYKQNFDAFYLPLLDDVAGTGKRCFDIFDFHWYGDKDDYKIAKGILGYIQEKITELNIPLPEAYWITEMGTYSGDPKVVDRGRKEVIDWPYQSEKQQAIDVVKRYVYPLSCGIKKIFLAWGLKEGFKYDEGYFDFTGLIYDGQFDYDQGVGVRKLSYYTYKKMVETLEGSDWGNIEAIHEQDDVYVYKFLKGGKPIYVVWNDNATERDIVIAGINSSQVKITEAVPKYELGKEVVDYNTSFTTETKSINGNQLTITVAEIPLFIEEQDSPFAIMAAFDASTLTTINAPDKTVWAGDHFKNLGAKWSRAGGDLIFWGSIEPVLGQGYNWVKIDEALKEIYQSAGDGFNQIVVISSSRGKGLNPDIPVTDEGYFKNFVKAAVERYDGDGINDYDSNIKVKYWQADNEPFPNHWEEKGGTIDGYIRFVELLSQAAKEADPEAKIILGTFQLQTPDQLADFEAVIPALKDRNVVMDYIDTHYWDEGVNYKILNSSQPRDILDSNGYSHVKMASLEFGTWTGRGLYPLEKDQAVFIIKGYFYNLANEFSLIAWNNLVEWNNFGGNPRSIYNFMGLIADGVNNDPVPAGTLRLSYYAYKKMTETLEGSDWDNIEKIQESDDVYIYKFLKGGKPIYVVWNDSGVEKEVAISNLAITQAKITEAVPHYEAGIDVQNHDEAFTSEIKQLSGGELIFSLGGTPKFIEEFSVEDDITLPSVPIITDEGLTSVNPSQLYASWESSDPESGISEYQYKITHDSPVGTVIRDWTSTGTANYVTAGGLSLENGKTYYFNVRAINGAGLESIGYSDGVTVLSNLTSYWSFDDVPGTMVPDLIGGNDGVIYGGALTTDGVSGYALEFDGLNDYVDVGNQTGLNTANYTVSAWIYHEEYTGSGDAVLGNSYWNSTSWFDSGIVMRFWGNDINLNYIAGNQVAGNPYTSAIIPLQTWTHVALSYDGQSGILKAYKNGELVSTVTVTGYGVSSRDLLIGSDHTNSGEVYFHGKIDEVMVFDKALTDDEIRGVYQQVSVDSPVSETVITIISPQDAGEVSSEGFLFYGTAQNNASGIAEVRVDIQECGTTLYSGPVDYDEGTNQWNIWLSPENHSPNESFVMQVMAKDNNGVWSEVEKVSVRLAPQLEPNNPPAASSQSLSLDEDATQSVTLTVTDADGDALSYTILTQPAHGILTGVVPNLTYAPNADYNGTDSFTFKANDGEADSNGATVSITVSPVNDAPVLDSVADITVNEGETITITPSATDVDGDELTYSYSGWITTNSYATDYDDAGGYTVTVTVSDGTLEDFQDVTVAVNNINRPPVFEPISEKVVTEGEHLEFSLYASDPDGDTLNYSVTNNPSNSGLSGGLFTFNPDCTQAGAYQVTFTADDANGGTESQTVAITVMDFQNITSVQLLERVTLGSGTRPEVVTANDRIFVVYLGNLGTRNQAFKLMILNSGLSEEIAAKDLVYATTEYGKPTDIRVASDGNYLYAFYETVIMGERAYLWGAKYTLDDNFEKVAYTAIPITSGPTFGSYQAGDEVVNDPIPVIGKDSVFVVTRIKQASTAKGEPTVYRVYEFSKDFSQKLSQFDLDLSSVADGEGRQTSIIYKDGYYYMVVPTTVEGVAKADILTPSDLLLVKLDSDWQIIETKFISQDANDAETFATGFEEKDGYYFLTYMRNQLNPVEFSAVLKVFDQNFDLVTSTTVKKTQPGKDSVEKPDLAVSGDKIFVALATLNDPQIEIYVYEIVR